MQRVSKEDLLFESALQENIRRGFLLFEDIFRKYDRTYDENEQGGALFNFSDYENEKKERRTLLNFSDREEEEEDVEGRNLFNFSDYENDLNRDEESDFSRSCDNHSVDYEEDFSINRSYQGDLKNNGHDLDSSNIFYSDYEDDSAGDSNCLDDTRYHSGYEDLGSDNDYYNSGYEDEGWNEEDIHKIKRASRRESLKRISPVKLTFESDCVTPRAKKLKFTSYDSYESSRDPLLTPINRDQPQ